MNDVFTATKALAAQARAEQRTLKVLTNSGSVYRLAPVAGGEWMIHRMGIDGRQTIDFGIVIAEESSHGREGLRIGPWTTTGLRTLELI